MEMGRTYGCVGRLPDIGVLFRGGGLDAQLHRAGGYQQLCRAVGRWLYSCVQWLCATSLVACILDVGVYADDSLYLYGFFYTATPCKIVLSAQSMQGYSDQGTTTTSDRLGFTVTSEEVSDATLTVVKGTNDSDSAVSTNAFVTHTGNTSGKTPVKGFKCIPLKIETTDPITSATSSSTVYYNTTITATIVADGINLEEMI